MHATSSYPVDTVSGGCFLTQRYELERGERVLDLDTYVDALPPFGRLVVSEKAVRLMAATLDIDIPTDDVAAENERLRTEIGELRAENLRMRRAFTQVVAAARLAGVAEYTNGLLEAS